MGSGQCCKAMWAAESRDSESGGEIKESPVTGPDLEFTISIRAGGLRLYSKNKVTNATLASEDANICHPRMTLQRKTCEVRPRIESARTSSPALKDLGVSHGLLD